MLVMLAHRGLAQTFVELWPVFQFLLLRPQGLLAFAARVLCRHAVHQLLNSAPCLQQRKRPVLDDVELS
jgi:hypothetical protein